MFKRGLFCGVLCGAAALASASWANGFYVSGSLGASVRPDFTGTEAEPTDPSGNKAIFNGAAVPYDLHERIQYSTGLSVDAAGGYRFDLGSSRGAVRVELDARYGQYSWSHASLQSLPSIVYATTWSSHSTGISGLQITTAISR